MNSFKNKNQKPDRKNVEKNSGKRVGKSRPEKANNQLNRRVK